MNLQRRVKFALPSWYGRLRPLTMKSVIIPLSVEFMRYLETDGVFLPNSIQDAHEADWSSDDEDENYPNEQDDGDEDDARRFYFDELQQEIAAGIDKLGGKVFPKLNWSSPRDASWIIGNTTCCRYVREIFLLLKSSANISIDVQLLRKCKDLGIEDIKPSLVLRTWYDYSPAGQLRCFVSQNRMIAVCQRDKSCYFPSLANNQERIGRVVVDWFDSELKGRFAEENFVVDVDIGDDNAVTLIDLDEFEESTDPILFDWETLKSCKPNEQGQVLVRMIESDCGNMQPSAILLNGIPSDLYGQSETQVDEIVDTLREHINKQSTDH